MDFNKFNSKRGFTLIELLVVIAIIAILAAILFPVFAQARAKARQASCLSNVKQLTLGMVMYSQDYDETFPQWNWGQQYAGGSGPGVEIWNNLWVNAIYPYVKNGQVYGCPDDRGRLTPLNSNVFWWTNLPTNDTNQWVNRGWVRELLNQKMSYGYNEPFNADGPSLARADRPAQTLLLSDMITLFTGGPSAGYPNKNDATDRRHKYIMRRVAYANQCDGTWWGGDQSVHQAAWDGSSCTRHSGGANIGYMDGHAKWSKANQITDDLYYGDQAN